MCTREHRCACSAAPLHLSRSPFPTRVSTDVCAALCPCTAAQLHAAGSRWGAALEVPLIISMGFCSRGAPLLSSARPPSRVARAPFPPVAFL